MNYHLAILLLFVVQPPSLWAEKPASKNEKELIMLEIEPITKEERPKRSSDEGAAARFARQSAAIPPEYLSLLQNFGPQGNKQHQQPLINELALARDGSKEPLAVRYLLSPDGRILQESFGAAALAQSPQFLPQPQQPAAQSAGRPILSSELAAFSREQTRLQQDYHDAPIRAQIAGLTTRPNPLAQSGQPAPPAGPSSPAPQAFPQPTPVAPRPQQFQFQLQPDPAAGLQAYYSQLGADPQALLAQSSLAQAQSPNRNVGFFYDQSEQQGPPPRLVFQPAKSQQAPSLAAPKKTLPPLGPSSQAQLLPQNVPLPQQYLIETTAAPQSPQSIPVPSPQFRYVIPEQPQPQPQIQEQPQQAQLYNALLQPTPPGRGLFTPTVGPIDKPSRSSIFVSRTSTKPVEELQSAKLPVVRLPSNPSQRPLSRQELDALINAGFSITPVDAENENYLKSKRQQPVLPQYEATSHVVYQNRQDGVEYQYSPGGSVGFKSRSKKFAPPELYKNLYRADTASDDSKRLVTYVLALDTPRQ